MEKEKLKQKDQRLFTREPLVRGSGTTAANGGGDEGDIGEMDRGTKMILLSLIPALSRGGELDKDNVNLGVCQ
jgi:hypothetical protein